MILVTGATGFLGKHLVELLLARGDNVRVLARGDGPSGVETLRGDVTDPNDVNRAVSGVRAIYHLAGIVSRDPAGEAIMRRVHVEGTRLICEAALRCNVERVVVASSSGTIAVSPDPVEWDESAGYKSETVARWPYYVTKIEQEKLALAFARDRGLPLVVINPSLLLGPGDDRNSSTGDVRRFLEGQVLSVPVGGLSMVDVRDCAAGAVLAMERGRPGERYLFGAVNWTMTRFLAELAGITGGAAPRMKSPAWLGLLTAPMLRSLMPLLGRKFDFDDESIRMSALFWYLDSAKARRELGFVTRDPRETLRATIDDLRRRSLPGSIA
ncbi:MAG: NAD-dependent epimerase/dehydratase family protein [Bryobacteraceae bacterium]